MQRAAMGFRVKSGRATVVLLAGPPERPEVVDVGVVPLSDPAVPDSAAPWHAALDLPKGEAAKTVKRLTGIVEAFSSRSVAQAIEAGRGGGRNIRGAGIVVGSVIDPAEIKNDHIRAHAEEGRLFRTVVETGARKAGLKTSVIVEKEIYERASGALGVPAKRLKEQVAALGRDLKRPWRAEEKTAALAAWTLLK